MPAPFTSPTPTQAAPAYAQSIAAQSTMQQSPQATEAVTAYFTRTGTEIGPGVTDVTKPDTGKPATAATPDAGSWIKPLLIGGAALISLAK
jgi:hypothetical protein